MFALGGFYAALTPSLLRDRLHQTSTAVGGADRRAELISSYQIVCFGGNAVPVVGVAMLSALFGAVTATMCLAVMVAGLSVLAVVTEARHRVAPMLHQKSA